MAGVTNSAIMHKLGDMEKATKAVADKVHDLEVQVTEQNATLVTQIRGMYDACPHQVAIANGKKGWALAQTLQGKLADHRVEVAKHLGSGALGGGVVGAVMLIARQFGWL